MCLLYHKWTGLGLNLWIGPTLFVWAHLTVSFPFIFKRRPSCPPVCPLAGLLHKANGHEFTSGRCRRATKTEGRQEENRLKKKKKGREGDLGGRKRRQKKCKSPMYFIWSSIIHLEMHLRWCKSVQSHPPFQAFTLKCLCGWSVLRQFGPSGPSSSPGLNKSLWHRAALIKLVRDL